MGKRKLRMTNRIKELRAEAGGLTQQELADRVGVTRQTVNAIEANKYSPSLEVAFLIAQNLQVQLEDAFGFIED
jgi:putative transcriptional regulator